MMTIMGKRYGRRGVSTVIAALLLIAISVAAAVLLYVFSIGLMGSLQAGGGQQTKDQIIMESYNWVAPTSLVLNLRNTGVTTVNLGGGASGAKYYVNGLLQTDPTPTCGSLAPQAFCTTTVAITGFSATAGVAYTIKIGAPDGAVFSYAAIAGGAS